MGVCDNTLLSGDLSFSVFFLKISSFRHYNVSLYAVAPHSSLNCFITLKFGLQAVLFFLVSSPGNALPISSSSFKWENSHFGTISCVGS